MSKFKDNTEPFLLELMENKITQEEITKKFLNGVSNSIKSKPVYKNNESYTVILKGISEYKPMGIYNVHYNTYFYKLFGVDGVKFYWTTSIENTPLHKKYISNSYKTKVSLKIIKPFKDGYLVNYVKPLEIL